MSKRMKNEPVVDDLEIKQEAPPVLTHSALGVFKDSAGHWHVARVKFNPETRQVGTMEIVPSEEVGRDAVLYKFRILAANEIMGNG